MGFSSGRGLHELRMSWSALCWPWAEGGRLPSVQKPSAELNLLWLRIKNNTLLFYLAALWCADGMLALSPRCMQISSVPSQDETFQEGAIGFCESYTFQEPRDEQINFLLVYCTVSITGDLWPGPRSSEVSAGSVNTISAG